MGVLDQLKSSLESPEKQAIEVDELGPDAWAAGAVALAGHDAMKKGVQEGTDVVRNIEGRPDYGETAKIDVAKSLQISEDYRSVLVAHLMEDRFEEPGTGDTSDYVLDSSIKDGSVSLNVVSEHADPSSSWDELADQQINNHGGHPSRLTFDKFSVNSISEPDQERYQIMQTIGGNVIFGFGRRPRIMQITGQVLNGRMYVKFGNETRSMDWKNALQRQYEDHFRLTACIKNRKRMLLRAQDTVYVGYLLAMQSMTSAGQQAIGQVTLTFVIAEREFMSQNDGEIPGRLSENGYPITDKTTPEELFPQARYEHYIQDSFDVQKEIDHTKDLIEETLTELVRTLYGSDGGIAETVGVGVFRGRMEDLWETFREVRMYRDYPDLNLKLHELVLAEGDPPFLEPIQERQALVDELNKKFADTYGYDPLRNPQSPDPSTDEHKAYETLIAQSSEKVNQTRLAQTKSDLLNELALQTMQYRQRLRKLKQL